MLTRITKSKLFSRLKDKRYRDIFNAGEVRRIVPFQLRALRAEREWTQAELGDKAGMPQTVISRIENGDAASLNLKTLLKLATAFDVSLVVRFEPVDRVLDWLDNLSPEVMSPRKAAEILAEMEAQSLTLPRDMALSAQQVSERIISATATGEIQTSTPFDTRLSVDKTGTVATFAAGPTNYLSIDNRAA